VTLLGFNDATFALTRRTTDPHERVRPPNWTERQSSFFETAKTMGATSRSPMSSGAFKRAM
jgi:hypothetical protein